MTHFDNFNYRQGDVAVHHVSEGDTGDGERDYAEHVSAQKLSKVERLVVVGALVLLGFAGLTGHLSSSMPDPLTTSSINSPAAHAEGSHHREFGHCREYSPYADRSC